MILECLKNYFKLKKAVRIITSSGWNVHSAPLLNTFILTLRNLKTFQVASFVYKVVNNTLPLSFSNYFVFNKDAHDHFTRHKENIHIL